MSNFISGTYCPLTNKILVWEKPTPTQRFARYYKPSYYFYVPNDQGDAIALNGQRVSRLDFSSKKKLEEACMHYQERYESDFSALERTLMDNYYMQPLPTLNTAFLDIEVDYDPKIGFSSSKNPYAPISAITIHKTQTKQTQTWCLAPQGWNGTLPADLSDVVICKDEAELLNSFLIAIEDADILSGWNSEYFDLPYIALRIERVLGQTQTKRLCFPEAPPPEWTEVERFGVKERVVNIYGRIHFDYLKAFRKFLNDGRQSYALGNIAAAELDGVTKLEYDGTLHELYNKDFERFIRYNRHDTELLIMLDNKFKFVALANEMAHAATVNFNAVFGSVQIIDTAIVNFAHYEMKRVVFDKQHLPDELVEGAIVMTPMIGLHRCLFSVDLVSLYPSTDRSLNLSPEKIIGQFIRFEADWLAIRNREEYPITMRLEDRDGTLVTETAKDWAEILQEKGFAISAHGTVIDQSSGEGLVSAVLTDWFNGRIALKNLKGEWAKKADAALKKANGDRTDPEYLEAKRQEDYFDLKQMNRKLMLNSQYGSMLNAFSRFHDPRLGASITGTGRQITTFMIETIAELIDGYRQNIQKEVYWDDKKGRNSSNYSHPSKSIIYGDTDSCYASLDGVVESIDEAIVVADSIAKELNDRFADFMAKNFFVRGEFLGRIKANREVVAESGIFRAKKKYMLSVVDLEGKRIKRGEPKSLKTMGDDTKLSTTPVVIKAFLRDITLKILWLEPGDDIGEQEILKSVIDFRNQIKLGDTIHPFDLAITSSVKVLEEYYQKWSKLEKPGIAKVNLPGNARAAINYNEMLAAFQDSTNPQIRSGEKIRILYLHKNELNFTSMAFPASLEHLPDWFQENFRVDMKLMEEKLVDDKLEKIFGPVGWEVPTRQSMFVKEAFTYE